MSLPPVQSPTPSRGQPQPPSLPPPRPVPTLQYTPPPRGDAATDALNQLSGCASAGAFCASSTAVAAALPQVRDAIDRSPLWLELHRRPDVLLATLRFAHGGADCAHGADYLALRNRLLEICPDRDVVTQCLKDMLLDALVGCMQPGPQATRLREVFDAARRCLERGELLLPSYSLAMEQALDQLEPFTRASALPPAQARLRQEMAHFGLAGMAVGMPAELVIDPERVDRYALVNATMVDHICRDHADRPVAQLEQMLAGYVERVFSRSPMQTWSAAGCRAPHELEQMLAVLRGWVWGMEHSAEASIRTAADLNGEQKHRALDAVRGAIDKWLFGLGWDEHLPAGGSPDRQGSAELWCEMLRCWRCHPASRDGLVDDPDELLPPPALRALWNCADTPGSWPSEAELRANRRDLLVIFDRCLSAYAIEGVQRETLQLALRAQIEKALRPDRGQAGDVDMTQEPM